MDTSKEILPDLEEIVKDPFTLEDLELLLRKKGLDPQEQTPELDEVCLTLIYMDDEECFTVQNQMYIASEAGSKKGTFSPWPEPVLKWLPLRDLGRVTLVEQHELALIKHLESEFSGHEITKIVRNWFTVPEVNESRNP